MVLFGESKMHSSCAIRSKKNTKQIKAQKMLFPTEEQHTKHELQYSKTEQVRKNKKKKKRTPTNNSETSARAECRRSVHSQTCHRTL